MTQQKLIFLIITSLVLLAYSSILVNAASITLYHCTDPACNTVSGTAFSFDCSASVCRYDKFNLWNDRFYKLVASSNTETIQSMEVKHSNGQCTITESCGQGQRSCELKLNVGWGCYSSNRPAGQQYGDNSFTVNIQPASCSVNWQCGNWGDCVNGQQSRSCSDANNCGTRASASETQSCTSQSQSSQQSQQTCTSDCSAEGQTQCVSGSYTQENKCTKTSDGCLKWSTTTCGYGWGCIGGTCVQCGDDCDVGDKNCVGNQVQYCNEIAPGCKKFSALADCPSGTTCKYEAGCLDNTGTEVQPTPMPDLLPPQEPKSCTTNTDCPTGDVCEAGVCKSTTQKISEPEKPIVFDKTPGKVLNNVNKCGKTLTNALANAIKPNAVCQPWGQWVFSSDSQDTVEKINAFGTEPAKIPVKWKCGKDFHLTGCCAQTSCWDGKTCQNNGAVFDAGKKGYYCNNGDWVLKPKKINYDKTEEGFCANDDQCLVTSAAPTTSTTDPLQFFKAAKKESFPRCVNNKAFLKDEYCDNGKWTSRTKQIAIQLLSLAETTSPTNYEIFCDTYENVLNRVKYDAGKGFVEQLIKEGNCIKEGTNKKVPCVNNFCVLKTPNGVSAIGTSLNTKINSKTSFLNALGVENTACDNTLTETRFTRCTSQTSIPGQVWHNPQTESIIYLPPQIPEISDTYVGYELAKILNYAETKDYTDPVQNFAFFKDTTALGKIMFSKKDQRTIFAVLEKQPSKDPASKTHYLGVRYSGFSIGTNPCLLIKNYFDRKTLCEKQTDQYDFVLISKDLKDLSQLMKWKDLTAKLRLISGQKVQMSADVSTSPPQQAATSEETEPDCPLEESTTK